MSTREGLLEAIRAEPDNDHLRLVYADFLEDEGDSANTARARLIRTQIKRSGLLPGDENQSPLLAEELRLVAAHGAAWRAAHFCFTTCRFRRGFIEYVKLHARHFLHHRRQLLRLEPVRDVCLTGLHGGAGSRLAGCAEWAQVESLSIYHSHRYIPEEDVLDLLGSPHFSRLKHLTLRGAEPRASFLRALVGLPSLRNLRSFRLNRIGEDNEALSAVVHAPWPHLQSLWLGSLRGGGQGLQAAGIASLCNSPLWQRLTALRLGLLRPDTEGLAELSRALGRSTSLRSLSLASFFAERATGAALLAALPSWPSLQELNLSHFNIDGETMQRFVAWPQLAGIQRLRLAHCNLGAAECRQLARAPFTGLTHLDLEANSLDVEELFPALNAPVLSSLELRRAIHLPGLTVLARWPGLARLQKLSVGSFSDPVDLRPLVASYHLENVVWLEAFQYVAPGRPGTGLTRPTTWALARLPHLAFLDLVGFAFSDGAEQALLDSSRLAWLCRGPGRSRGIPGCSHRRSQGVPFDANPLPLDETVAHFYRNAGDC